jgi:hypothetical protein
VLLQRTCVKRRGRTFDVLWAPRLRLRAREPQGRSFSVIHCGRGCSVPHHTPGRYHLRSEGIRSIHQGQIRTAAGVRQQLTANRPEPACVPAACSRGVSSGLRLSSSVPESGAAHGSSSRTWREPGGRLRTRAPDSRSHARFRPSAVLVTIVVTSERRPSARRRLRVVVAFRGHDRGDADERDLLTFGGLGTYAVYSLDPAWYLHRAKMPTSAGFEQSGRWCPAP